MSKSKLFLFITYIFASTGVSASQLPRETRQERDARHNRQSLLDGQLSLAVSFKFTQKARELIDLGANVNSRQGIAVTNTLLMEAIRGRDKEMVKLLLDHGADVNTLNNVGETALDIAAGQLNKELVFLLLEKGADRSLGKLKDWKNAPQEIKNIFYKFENPEMQEKYNREKVEPCIVESIEEVAFPPELGGEVAEYAAIEAPVEEYEKAYQENEKKNTQQQ